jgi:hypothetical protein
MAIGDMAPTATTTNAILAGYSKVKSEFAVSSPEFFSVDELGGEYCSRGGTGSETTTSSLTENVALNLLTTRGNLLIGLYGGDGFGSGVTSVTFTLSVDGEPDAIDETFTSAAAAQAYFTDDALPPIGSLADGSTLVGTNNTLNVVATLSVTTDAADSGFFGDLIIGDPPSVSTSKLAAVASTTHTSTVDTSTTQTSTAAGASKFVAAMASFKPKLGALIDVGSSDQAHVSVLLTTPRYAQAA